MKAIQVNRPFIGLFSVQLVNIVFRLLQLTCSKEKDLVLFINVLILFEQYTMDNRLNQN